MKKIILLAASAALVFASCSNDQEGIAEIKEVNGNAISFSAYTNSSVTRGSIVEAYSDVIATGEGIGVFAFYQANEKFNTHKFATPDFMYNQKVTATETSAPTFYADADEYNAAQTPTTSLTTAEFAALPYSQKIKTAGVYSWEYHPVKYWPNNSGDMLSFFAYAPYDKKTQWEDLGVKTDINGTKMTVTFPIYQEVRDQKDQLWAAPTFNQEKQATVPGTAAVAGTHNVQFQFKHVTAQVSLYVGIENDAKTKAPTYWTDENTEITINSVEFKGLKESITYTYDLNASPVTEIPSYAGKQNIKLTSDNFVAEAALINDDTWKDDAASTAWVRKAYTGDAKWKKLTTADDYMFLAPQTFDADAKDFVITYTVKTTNTPANAANDSEIQNVITKNIKDIVPAFEAGKAYKIYCLIGMTSVKFYVTVADWATATNHQVDVPANN